jgi:hypothetical protein
MPRERVQHGRITVREEHPGTKDFPGAILEREYRPEESLPPGATLHEAPSLDVLWSREYGSVQMGFEAPREWWDRFIESYQANKEMTHYGAFTELFSRTEINHMIKTLRRARDAAYGADE